MNEMPIDIRTLFSDPQALLVFAVVLLVFFAGFLFFDPFGNSRRRHHRHGHPLPRLTLRQRLAKPLVQMRASWQVLRSYARRRARRRARAERAAEQMRRFSR